MDISHNLWQKSAAIHSCIFILRILISMIFVTIFLYMFTLVKILLENGLNYYREFIDIKAV